MDKRTFTMRVFDDMPDENWWLQMENLRAPNKMATGTRLKDEIIEEINFEEDRVEDEEQNINEEEPTLNNSSENVPFTQALTENTNFMTEIVISENRDNMFTSQDDLEEVNRMKPEEDITGNSHQTTLILMENTNNISNNTSENCDEVFPNNDYLENSSHSGNTKCKHCNKSFKSQRNYKKHALTHTDKCRLFKCTFCDKHILKLKDLKCKHCSKTFQRKDQLNKHLLIHNDKSPLNCKYCGRKFQRKDHFKNHELNHVDDSRFKCRHCDKKFVSKGHYKNHLLKHKINRI